MAKCLTESALGTGPDTYLYTVARAGHYFATIGSDDALRIFDGSLKLTRRIPSAHHGISCLTATQDGFFTGGRDGVIRCWSSSGQRVGVELLDPRGNPFSAITCRDNYVAAGTESVKEGLGEVSVLLYDTRNPSTPVRSYVDSHTDTITQLAFHPSQSNLLLSGSTDGLVSLFDCNIEDEEDALLQVLNPRSAVHCAGFVSDTEVYVVTTDEHLSFHSLKDDLGAESSIIDLGDVREQLQCMYVANFINGTQPMLACGHNVNQTLSLVQLDFSRGRQFGSVIDLPGAHGEEVVRDVLIMDAEKKALSCGEDGYVKLWDLAKAVPRSLEAMDVG